MRIWMINHYAFKPSQPGGTRHFSLAREWVRRGHQVTIVAASVSHFQQEQASRTKGPCEREILDGVEFISVATPKYRGNGPRRLLNMLSFAWRVYVTVPRFVQRRPDVIIGSTPQPFAAFSAERLARRFEIPFIAEVRDLWPQSLLDVGQFSSRHPLVLILSRVERHLYSAAAHVVTVLQRSVEYIVAHGGARDRVTWIPNGIDMAFAADVAPIQTRGEEFIVMYAGAHGAANALETVLDAARILEREHGGHPVRFVLIGDGPTKPHLQERARSESITNIDFLDPVPKNKIHELMSHADAFVLTLAASPVFRWGISPNKLYDYMISGRPVIFAVESPTNPVAASGSGMTIPPENGARLAGAVLELANMPVERRAAMGAAGREYVEKNYDMSMLARRYEAVMEHVCAREEKAI